MKNLKESGVAYFMTFLRSLADTEENHEEPVNIARILNRLPLE
jgi:hypothetical protein